MVGSSARDLYSLNIQAPSYKLYPPIALYLEYLTESISVLHSITTVTAAEIALKKRLFSPRSHAIIMCWHFPKGGDWIPWAIFSWAIVSLISAALAGCCSAKSWESKDRTTQHVQGHQGAALVNQTLCSVTESWQEPRDLSSIGRLQHAAEESLKLCQCPHCPLGLQSQTTHYFPKRAAVNFLQAEPQNTLLTLEEIYKYQRCKGVFSLFKKHGLFRCKCFPAASK